MRSVESEEAEQTCSDLRLIEAQYLRSRRQQPSLRIGRIQSRDPELAERAAQLVLANVVAVTEFFCDERLNKARQTVIAATSWPAREMAWSHCGVNLATLTNYLPFRGFNEARNAIMHGLGSLTSSQKRPDRVVDVKARLAAASIALLRSRIVVADQDIARCVSSCINFVLELDTSAP